MQPRRLELTEWKLSPGVGLTQEECDQLRSVCGSLRISPTPGKRGHYDVQPESEVGVINVGSLTVEIRPKLPIDRVLFLVSYALDPKAWRDKHFRFGEVDSVYEAIVPGFAHQLRRALARGLLRSYRVEEEALPTVRGRIRLQDQIRRRYGLAPPVEVRYDDFTEDIEENRLLRAALTKIERLPLRQPQSRQPLKAFELALGEVSLVRYDRRQLPTINWTRLNEHYRPAVELAKLILRSASPELGHGAVQTSAFLIDMNDVFENFVVVALREELRLTVRSFPQGAVTKALYLDEAGRLRLKPDISWWEGGRCVFVGDVKYKRLLAAGMQHADLYQLLAYLVATDLKRGLLIYAATEAEPASHKVLHLGRELYVAELAVNGAPSEILSRVEQLGRMVLSLRETDSPAVHAMPSLLRTYVAAVT